MESDGIMAVWTSWNRPHPIQPYKSLRGHSVLSLKLPILKAKTRPELALWLPTHWDPVSDSAQGASSLLPSSQMPGAESAQPGGVSEQLPLQGGLRYLKR